MLLLLSTPVTSDSFSVCLSSAFRKVCQTHCQLVAAYGEQDRLVHEIPQVGSHVDAGHVVERDPALARGPRCRRVPLTAGGGRRRTGASAATGWAALVSAWA
jgi:hypothetical protein